MSYSSFHSSFTEAARVNRFQVNGLGLDNLFVKAASLPGSSIGVVDVFHEGKPVKLAGDRTNEDWTVTCYLDVKSSNFTTMKVWSELVLSNVANIAPLTKDLYKRELQVSMLGRDGSTITGTNHILSGAFPINMSPVELDHSSNDAAAEFSITFAYDWFIAV